MKEDKNNKWYGFMATNEWAIFMNIMRIATFILVIGLAFWLWKEIDAIKLLAYDPCKICMNKTGCICSCMNLPY